VRLAVAHWGVPIPLFVDKVTGELHPRTAELIEGDRSILERDGIDAWFNLECPRRCWDRTRRKYDNGHGRHGRVVSIREWPITA